MTLRTADGFHTPAETDPLATRLDEIQYRLDAGPCVQATRKSGLGLTYSADLGSTAEFGAFGPAAAEPGVHSVLAVGLFPDGAGPRMGALNIYSRVRRGVRRAPRRVAVPQREAGADRPDAGGPPHRGLRTRSPPDRPG